VTFQTSSNHSDSGLFIRQQLHSPLEPSDIDLECVFARPIQEK
jgi:hypothetical protein